MVTIRTANVPAGRLLFQIDDQADPIFHSQIALAINLLSDRDLDVIMQRALRMNPNVHMTVRVERGLIIERLIHEQNPFVTMLRSTTLNDQILVIYTILQN